MSRRLVFCAQWWPTVAAVAAVALFVSLGNWQVQRAEWKRGLQAEFDARHDLRPVTVTGRERPPEALRFFPVVARGIYDEAHQILLDNRVHEGRPGYHVITPLRLAGGEHRLLVNRGFVPLGPDRSRLPPAPAPRGEVEVWGIASEPSLARFRLGHFEPQAQPWQPLWPYFDVPSYAAAAPFPVHPVVVLLAPEAEAGGYVRVWARLDAGIATHEGYAFTWFALAAVVTLVYLMLSLRWQARPHVS